MNKIVVTGATSMLGTALIEVAVREGTEVFAIIRPDTKRKDRIIDSPLVHPLFCSLDKLSGITEMPSGIDALYHFAWAGTSKADRDDPNLQNWNISHTMDAVELAYKIGCKRFIGVGSQAEYGPLKEEIDENTSFKPETSYGIAKYAAGLLSQKLCVKKGIEHSWGRVFSVYGPHDNEGTMLKSAIKSWNNGETVHFSSGEQYWNYLYESDAGEMFYRMGCREIPAGTYFVANSESRKLKEYIEILMNSYGEDVKAVFAEAPKEKPPGLDVNMTKTTQILKYEPKVSFEEGIGKMIKATVSMQHE